MPPKKMKKPKHQVDDSGYQSDSAIIDPQEEDMEVKREDTLKGKNKASEWRETLPPVGNEDGDDNVTDLVLIVHGIGQGVNAPFLPIAALTHDLHFSLQRHMRASTSYMQRISSVRYLGALFTSSYQMGLLIVFQPSVFDSCSSVYYARQACPIPSCPMEDEFESRCG